MELLEHYDAPSTARVTAVLGDEEKIWNFLSSNELWGGAGSVADQALIEFPDARKQLEILLIGLGREQLSLKRVNVHTEMWVSAFEKWHADEM